VALEYLRAVWSEGTDVARHQDRQELALGVFRSDIDTNTNANANANTNTMCATFCADSVI
jgi:hypothetical protein